MLNHPSKLKSTLNDTKMSSLHFFCRFPCSTLQWTSHFVCAQLLLTRAVVKDEMETLLNGDAGGKNDRGEGCEWNKWCWMDIWWAGAEICRERGLDQIGAYVPAKPTTILQAGPPEKNRHPSRTWRLVTSGEVFVTYLSLEGVFELHLRLEGFSNLIWARRVFSNFIWVWKVFSNFIWAWRVFRITSVTRRRPH